MIDDAYLIKLVGAKMPIHMIAMRVGATVAEVEARWKELQAVAHAAQESGHQNLCNQVAVLAHQYQLVGESLKILAGAVGASMSPAELRPLITADPEQTLENLFKHCIILKPFTPVDPVESLERHLKQVREGN